MKDDRKLIVRHFYARAARTFIIQYRLEIKYYPESPSGVGIYCAGYFERELNGKEIPDEFSEFVLDLRSIFTWKKDLGTINFIKYFACTNTSFSFSFSKLYINEPTFPNDSFDFRYLDAKNDDEARLLAEIVD